MNAPAPIGQTLLDQGLVSADQLHIALREQQHSGDALGRQLVRLGFVSEATLREALAYTLARNSIDLTHAVPDADALDLVPQHLARRLRLLPLSYDAARRLLVVASSEADNLVAIDQLQSLLPPGGKIETLLAGDSEIASAQRITIDIECRAFSQI